MSNTTRSNNFDFIRFVCASFVIITHGLTFLGHWQDDWLGLLSQKHYPFSFYGVRVFFIISGFLIAQSLYNDDNLLSFFWKRCLRIFPGLFVVICFCLLIVGPIFTTLPLAQYLTSYET
jgi:peptidoglycan/LPS O-acetylase OafA/YrhL